MPTLVTQALLCIIPFQIVLGFQSKYKPIRLYYGQLCFRDEGILKLKYTNPAKGILYFCKQKLFGPSYAFN